MGLFQEKEAVMDKEKKDKLYILWTNADPVTAKLMVMMYGKKFSEKRMVEGSHRGRVGSYSKAPGGE